jgi:hypothetical protein
MLLLYELHRVRGVAEFEFEAAFRDGWMPRMAGDDDARLLWYFHLAHGSNVSYRFVTITALRDFGAWERLALRIQSGDLREWMAALDTSRYQLDAKLLAPLPWSPMQEVDFAGVPAEPKEPHGLELYLEDTVRSEEGRIEETIEAAGRLYAEEAGAARPGRMSHLVGAFQPFWGAGRRRELVLLHRVDDKDALAGYYMTGRNGGSAWPAVNAGDRLGDAWETRVLRTANWSPLA